MPRKTPHQKFAEGLYEACTGMKLKEASPVLRGALVGAGIGAAGNAIHKGYKAHARGEDVVGAVKHGAAKGALAGAGVGAGAGLVHPKGVNKITRAAKGAIKGAKLGAKGKKVTSWENPNKLIPVAKRVSQ